MGAHRFRLALIIAAAALLLGLATTAVFSTFLPRPRGSVVNARPTCSTPELPGTVVDVALTDMGAMMGPRMMRDSGGNGRYWPSAREYQGLHGYSWPGMGMMRIFSSQATVPGGPVSLRVSNAGVMVHEITVLPLDPGQNPGQRAIGPDAKVDESASVGHAARSCGTGDGDGIAPGSIGWTTITLAPGRYELICNITGHYAAGMYTELDVEGSR